MDSWRLTISLFDVMETLKKQFPFAISSISFPITVQFTIGTYQVESNYTELVAESTYVCVSR